MRRKDTPQTPEEFAETCICQRIQRAGRAVGRIFDDAFRPLDITNWQFSLLVQLNRPVPLTIGELAERLASDRSTVTANLKPLERRKLLQIFQDKDDRRVRRVALTATGQALIDEALPLWQKTNDKMIGRVKGISPATLHSTLENLIQT